MKIERINFALDEYAIAPYQATLDSAGSDLYIKANNEVVNLTPHRVNMVDTGVHVELPQGTVGIVCVRSSIAKRGITLAGGIGVIDSDYRGSIRLPLINNTAEEKVLNAGDRVAQLLIIPTLTPMFNLIDVDELSNTKRGTGGFGSTGR